MLSRMFNEIVEKLIQSGMTESEIAAKVGSSQPSINRIRRGKQKNVGYSLGDALLTLLAERCPDRPSSDCVKRQCAA
jgi:transcriptional regulator with XRE-family HTH domain